MNFYHKSSNFNVNNQRHEYKFLLKIDFAKILTQKDDK